MKKLFMIAMVAMFATVACKEDSTDTVVETKPSIAVAVTPSEIAVDAKANFTVTATNAVEADLTVTIKVDKADVLTVPASAVIKKGEKTVSFEGIAKAEGTAITTISCAEATITTATANVKVTGGEVPESIKLTSSAPALTYSTATGGVSAIVNLTLSKAVSGKITIETGYNFDNWDWTNNAEGFPNGVTWSEYPVVFPAGETTHSFSLEIEQGNAGTLPLLLVSISGAGAKDVEFESAEYDFVITK